MFKFLAYALIAFVSIYLQKCHCKSIGQLMRNSLIVPWVYHIAPNETCRVSYPIYNMKATPGGEINALEARKKPPKVRWNGRRNGIYTMIMISPDIWGDGNPENKSYCEWDPWVVVNIPGRKMLKGNTVKKYKIPEKPRRDGTLYYVFLIFQQPEFLYFVEEAVDISPDTFRLEWFVIKYGLTGPIAGNFFNMIYPEASTLGYYGPREARFLLHLGATMNTTRSKYWTKFKSRSSTTVDPYYYHSSEYEDSDDDEDGSGSKKKKKKTT